MIYRSNLIAPDLTPCFDLHSPPLQTCGHDMPSDRVYDPNCGFWTHDEAAILLNVVAQARAGVWLDIGSRMGWTTAHIIAGGARGVVAVDPAYTDPAFRARALAAQAQVLKKVRCDIWICPMASGDYFEQNSKLTPGIYPQYRGVVIDGNHDSPYVDQDAVGAACYTFPDAYVLFHDFWGRPIREGVERLLGLGWMCKIYDTPNGVAVCWRGAMPTPPDHTPDPAIDWKQLRRSRAPEFDYSRCI